VTGGTIRSPNKKIKIVCKVNLEYIPGLEKLGLGLSQLGLGPGQLRLECLNERILIRAGHLKRRSGYQ
jgi:hypothetical protein